ncbi:MAG TPA: hypothetical protein VGK32_21800 [Vicinamibacterales bacterium]|jgi:hypothetical protein
MWRNLKKTSTIVYASYDFTDATTLFAEDFMARPGDPFDISLDLTKNLRTRNKDEDTYIDARELADGAISGLRTVQIDDKQVIERIRLKLSDLPAPPKQWRLRVQLEGDHWYAVRPEAPAGTSDTLLLHVASVLDGPVAEPPSKTGRAVVVPFACGHCREPLEVDCAHTPGFAQMNFYRFDCPKCGKDNHQQLPGDIVDVRVAGEQGDDDDRG